MKNPVKTSSPAVKFAAVAMTLCGALAAHADISTFTTPSFRGQPGTQSAYWETFTNAYNGANLPNGISVGGLSLANATLTQTADPSAFLTGTANIYDFANPTGFQLSYSGGLEAGQVVFQTRTAGSEIDYSSVALTYDLGSGPTSLSATRIPLEDLLGGVTSEWIWDLSGVGVNNFTIGFNASAASMSFDSAMLDVAPVPEPGSVALFGLAGAGLIGMRLARRKS